VPVFAPRPDHVRERRQALFEESLKMALRRMLMASGLVVAMAGCASNTFAPNYQSNNTDILRIGGERPDAAAPAIEDLGSFCVQTTQQWNDQGKTPDGQRLWVKSTLRQAVACR
jgi:hypothetical protein